jgi:hypothetical protein
MLGRFNMSDDIDKKDWWNDVNLDPEVIAARSSEPPGCTGKEVSEMAESKSDLCGVEVATDPKTGKPDYCPLPKGHYPETPHMLDLSEWAKDPSITTGANDAGVRENWTVGSEPSRQPDQEKKENNIKMMEPLEALADAIMQFEGWRLGTRSWRNRNPGNLRRSNPIQIVDKDGYRIFDSLDKGWLALNNDLASKFHGSHNLSLNSTLLDLLNVYAPAGDNNNPTAYTKFICKWTTAILQRDILPTTTIKEYLDG